MRKAINENPMVQIGVLAGAAVIFAFILFTSVLKKDDTAAPVDPGRRDGDRRPGRDRDRRRGRPRRFDRSPVVHCSRRRHGVPPTATTSPAPSTAPPAGGSVSDGLLPSKGLPKDPPRRVRQEQRDRPARHRSERDLRQAGQGLHGDPQEAGRRRGLHRRRQGHRRLLAGDRGRLGQPRPRPRRGSSRASSPTRYRPPRSPTASAARAASTRRSTTRCMRASRSRPTRRGATRRRTRARTGK